MRLGLKRRLGTAGIVVLVLATALALALAHAPSGMIPKASAAPLSQPFCAAHPSLCTETTEPWNYAGQYTGHDEPSVLFYSNTPGSGNSSLYRLILPKDPPTAPKNNGTGGVWNFMLHPAFWFGMALCDNQSAPSPGKACPPNTDANIYTSTDPNSPRYIGKTPGTAFMEMQFYPPGWGGVGTGVSCGPDNTQWCGALNIDSFSNNENTGALNNAACLKLTGEEYVNYAIITKNGVPNGPPAPGEQTAATLSTTANTLEMNSGDALTVALHDTAAGFQVVIHDLTTGQSGSMTASAANGFGHPLFQPNAKTCTISHYTFHPMFSTSSPSTRVLWAAHTYNIAYSDEIGHAEYCSNVNKNGACTHSVSDVGGTDGDDNSASSCQTLNTVQPVGDPPTTSVSFNLCNVATPENDFDGVPYQHNWPGSIRDGSDQVVHSQPVTFTSPLFMGSGGLQNYGQVAFETDLPRIEGADVSPNNACQRHVFNPSDPHPGAGCVNPPNGSSFYPFFSTANVGGACYWEEGDKYLPNVTNQFGGSSTAEFGNLLVNIYPSTGFTTQGIFENFHRTLGNNPCPAPGGN